MPRHLVLTARALADVAAAKQYLLDEAGQPIVDTFESEVDRALALIQAFPRAAPIYRGAVRRLAMSKYPYTLYYRPAEDRLVIVALEHQCRDPRRLRLR